MGRVSSIDKYDLDSLVWVPLQPRVFVHAHYHWDTPSLAYTKALIFELQRGSEGED